MGLRDQILGARDWKAERVRVPEWDAEVELRGISAGAFFRIQRAAQLDNGNGHGQDTAKLYADLLVASAHDPETGARLFQDADRDAVAGKSVAVLERLATVIARLNGVTPSASAALEGNSDATASAGPPSDSPSA